MVRQIKIDVKGEFCEKDSKTAGSAHSANAVKLSISFDDKWDNFSKRILFYDAREEKAVAILLGTGVEIADETVEWEEDRMILPIPGEPMKYPGWMSFVIEGYYPDEPSKVLLSVRDYLYVHPSEDEGIKPAEPTPSQILQLKSYIDSKVSEEYGAIATINHIASPKGNILLEGGTGVRVTSNSEMKKILFEATGEMLPGLHGYTHKKYGSDPFILTAEEIEYGESDVKSVVEAHKGLNISQGVHGIREQDGVVQYQSNGQWHNIEKGIGTQYADKVHTHDVSEIEGALRTDGTEIRLGKLRIMSSVSAAGAPYAIFSLND